MLIFKLERTEEFLEAAAVLAEISTRCHFKLSKGMFSLHIFHHSFRCKIALQIMPYFFTTYNFFNQNPNSSFFIDAFFTALLYCQRIGSSSLSFHLAQLLPLAELISDQSCHTRRVIQLSFTAAAPAERPTTEIDYTIFVSIELQDFKPIAITFDQAPYVRVALTDSRVTFSYEDCIITLTVESHECVIGGVEGEDDAVQLILIPIPMTAFQSITITGLSKRVWIFKSNHDFNAVVSIPLGLDSRFFVAFPQLM